MSPLAAIFYREVKIRSTNITFLFFDLFYPLLYLLVFGVGVNAALGAPSLGAGIDYNSFFIAGVLGMASFGIATTSSWSFFLDRDNGIFYEMLTYPMRRSEYLLGKVLFNVCVGVVQAAITVGLGCWLLKIHLQWNFVPILAALVIGGAAGWFFFYSIFALKIRRNDVFNSVVNVSYFVFLFASAVVRPAGFRSVRLRASSDGQKRSADSGWSARPARPRRLTRSAPTSGSSASAECCPRRPSSRSSRT